MAETEPTKKNPFEKLQSHFDRASVLYFVGLIFAMGLFTGTSNSTNSKQDELLVKHDIRITKIEDRHGAETAEPARNDERLKQVEKKNEEQDGLINSFSKDMKDTKDITIETQKMVIEIWEDKTGKKYHAPINK